MRQKKLRQKKLTRSTKIMAGKMSRAGQDVGEIAKELDVLATPLKAYLKAKWLEWCLEALHDFVIRRDRACVTCGSTKDLQAGHFIQGRRHSLLFDHTNVHAQCEQCNMYHGGELIAYTRFMQDKYGNEYIDFLIRENNKTVVLYIDDLRQIWKALQ